MPDGAATATAPDRGVAEALRWIELLASDVGPRRPTGRAERVAAEAVRSELIAAGVPAELEEFDGYASFGPPYGAILAAAVAPALLPRRRRAARAAIALAAGAALASEGSLRWTPLSDALSRRRSQNVVAAIEPRAEARRTLCLVCHLDTSRSGLVFHPAFQAYLLRWISAQSAAVLVGVGEPVLARFRAGRAALAGARAIAAAGLALLAERELRGADVPGASDNASGVAVAAGLMLEHADRRLESTRLVFLATGCEESGLLGMQAFLHEHDTSGWLFLNVDSVGGPGTVRYLAREGVLQRWPADPRMLAVAERVARRRPELGLSREDDPAGLTYDTTAVLARGGRGLTLSVQDGTIPNLHWPTDTPENVDPGAIARTLEAAREIVAAIDRGEAG